jgi:hypothetical protein
MKPLFTVHAGEYLVASHIETCYPKWKVWLPAKDTGIDLLVTNTSNTKSVSLQVKFSKDWNLSLSALLQRKIVASGWWTHLQSKISNSPADFWVFAIPSFTEHENNFIIIPPRELLRRLRNIHGKGKRIHSYFWVTQSRKCWEARGLNNADKEMIAYDRFRNNTRDFTQFLDAWESLQKRLGK